MPIAAFDCVVLDCPDPHGLAAFYQQIVGGEIDPATLEDDWATLKVHGASDLGFQLAPDHEAPDWPTGSAQQAHLDFNVTDLAAGEAAVVALGAVKADVQPTPDEWLVFTDPAGHPFCLIQV